MGEGEGEGEGEGRSERGTGQVDMAIHFAFRCYQFAGGFNSDASQCAFLSPPPTCCAVCVFVHARVAFCPHGCA